MCHWCFSASVFETQDGKLLITPAIWEERVLSKFFANWGGSNLFYSQPGEGHSFFGKEKNIIYACRKIYISKNYLLPTNIIVSLDPYPPSPIFWCFRAGFCDLLLSKPRERPLALSFSHETVVKAFLVGTSGPKWQVEFWQNTIWEFSIFALWVR